MNAPPENTIYLSEFRCLLRDLFWGIARVTSFFGGDPQKPLNTTGVLRIYALPNFARAWGRTKTSEGEHRG